MRLERDESLKRQDNVLKAKVPSIDLISCMNPFYSNLSFKKSLKIIDLFLINIFQTFVRKILTPNTAVFCITLLSRVTRQIQPKICILNILPHTRAPKAVQVQYLCIT